MADQLARKLTTWKAWYALLGIPAFLLGSFVAFLGGLTEGQSASVRRTVGGLLVPVQFLAMAFLALGAVALVARKWPTRRDLGLRRKVTWGEIGLLVAVFVVTHVLFWLLSRGGESTADQARRYFTETGLDGPLVPAVAGIVSSTVLAPVCEELVYRGVMLRPIHDALARRGRAWLGAAVGILVSAVFFALPHLGGDVFGVQGLSYLVTGVAFGLVYVLTGSMTAAMVSHSLQSCFAFAQIVLFGAGTTQVSPIIYAIVFGCPLWTYLCALGLHAILPRGHVEPGETAH